MVGILARAVATVAILIGGTMVLFGAVLFIGWALFDSGDGTGIYLLFIGAAACVAPFLIAPFGDAWRDAASRVPPMPDNPFEVDDDRYSGIGDYLNRG